MILKRLGRTLAFETYFLGCAGCKTTTVLSSEFGGYPHKITVVGESSGATMIRPLLTTTKASGLFQGAILQYGPQNHDANYQNVSRQVLSPYIASLVGYTTLTCLQSVPVNDVIGAEINSNITLFPSVSLDPTLTTISSLSDLGMQWSNAHLRTTCRLIQDLWPMKLPPR